MTKRQVDECLARFVSRLPPNVPVPKYVFDLWEWMENGQRDKPVIRAETKKAIVIPIHGIMPEYVLRVRQRFLKNN